MRRKKHKNDTKANTYIERWVRSKEYRWGNFKHSDWRIEGIFNKRKRIENLLREEANV